MARMTRLDSQCQTSRRTAAFCAIRRESMAAGNSGNLAFARRPLPLFLGSSAPVRRIRDISGTSGDTQAALNRVWNTASLTVLNLFGESTWADRSQGQAGLDQYQGRIHRRCLLEQRWARPVACDRYLRQDCRSARVTLCVLAPMPGRARSR